LLRATQKHQEGFLKFLASKASISYNIKAVVDTTDQPFLDGIQIDAQKTFVVEGESFDEFWADSNSELYQLALVSLGVVPDSVIKTTTIHDYENPENNSTVSVEL
jgi:hypothetical protein